VGTTAATRTAVAAAADQAGATLEEEYDSYFDGLFL